jgi:hypothetical protein
MKKRSFLYIPFVLVCMIFLNHCSSKGSDQKSTLMCPIRVGPEGAAFWAFPEKPETLFGGTIIKMCSIKQYENGSPLRGEDAWGNKYEQTVEKGQKSELIQVAERENPSRSVDGPRFNFYKGMGEHAKWIGTPKYGGNIYQMLGEDNFVKVGEGMLYDFGPDYAKRLVTKGTTANEKWTYAKNGEVYQIIEKQHVLVGHYAYHWVTPENEERLKTLVLMSKGLDEKAKWWGMKDGVIYREK